MAPLNPRKQLATHEVSNQPPPLGDLNLYTSDTVLRSVVNSASALEHEPRLAEFGRRAGSQETAEWAAEANRYIPELKIFDRFGQRIDEVSFHPSYHKLMELGLNAGIASIAWTASKSGHTAHSAILYMMAQIEAGVCCPMTMTYAALPALRHQRDVAATWESLLTSAQYDPASMPAKFKKGVTIGMAMTEKQGGSDVRANTTRADRTAGNYHLTGHKWFCSAPMCDAFLTLGYTETGLTCFLVPRWTPDGERNGMQIQRLKEKLGDRANASSEIEYHNAFAVRIGEEGRGVRTIIEMVHHTRLDCTIAPAAYMRQALLQTLWHTTHRTAFQRKLVDQPLMARVLADLALESEAATILAFRVAKSFDEAKDDESAALFSRLATPIGKYWLNKRVVNFVYEAMECHGGAGYVEESVLPRLYRQSPLNSIWEGSGNVICLDVLRALTREPACAEALVAEIELAKGAGTELDRAIGQAKDQLTSATEPQARRLVEELALVLQATLLTRFSPSAIADAFVATRLGESPWRTYGAFYANLDLNAILTRAMPSCQSVGTSIRNKHVACLKRVENPLR